MKKLSAHLILFLVFLIPIISLAQQPGGVNTNPSSPGGANTQQPTQIKINIQNPLKNNVTDLKGLLDLIIDKAILPLGGVVAAIMIIYAGFLYVTARGNETKIQTAHKALLYAAIGTAILLGAKVLSEAIQTTVTNIGK